MTTALITGIGGQDGSYLAEHLLAEGTVVHGLHHVGEPPPADCPDGVVLHLGDVTDHEATARLLHDVRPDEVYHLAALSSVARSWDQPDLVRRVNADAAIALMDAAVDLQERSGGPVAFVQASSAEIFGDPAVSPQDEDTPIRPVNPYGEAKAAAHAHVATVRARGLAATSAILYNHESPRRPPTFVTRRITSGVAAFARGEASTLTLGDLDARRDWGWAPDYVAGLVLAARAAEPGDFVFATGESRAVRDFVAAAFEAAGLEDWQGSVTSDPALRRTVDSRRQVGDPRRAERVLGWTRTMTFEQIVGAMVAADLAAPQRPSNPNR